MNIKTFIIGGVVGMVVALLCAVLVWWYVQGMFMPVADTSSPFATSTPGQSTSTTEEREVIQTTATATASGVPATDLPITDSQRQLAESLGINVDQVVISEAVIRCVRDTLGTGRYEQILAGDTPSFIEGVRLLPCLR